MRAPLPCALLIAATCLGAHPALAQQPSEQVTQPPTTPTFFVPAGANTQDTDMRFLCAVAAAATGTTPPLVLAVDAKAPWRPELLDFLRRAEPTQLLQLGELPPPPAPWNGKLSTSDANDSTGIACELAARFFPTAKSAVLCTFAERGAALSAAVLAARLHVPLLPCTRDGLDERVRVQLASSGITQVIPVGRDAPTKLDGLRTERLLDDAAVAGKLAAEKLPIEYVAAVQADDDRASHAAQLSLAGVLLAVARRGTVAITPGDVHWKERSATTKLSEAPKGAAPSANGWYRGEVQDGKAKHSFVTGFDPKAQRAFVQFDRNGDGDFADTDETPLRTGAVIELDRRHHAIDLDVDEHARGQGLWLTTPTAEDIAASIQRVRTASRCAPDMLCLVGWPDTLPMAIVGDAQPIDADLVSDIPIAQTDADPFVDLAMARFVTEDLPSATLLACRGFVHTTFRERSYAHHFATAEWAGSDFKPLLEAAGMQFAGHHGGKEFLASGSPLANVALVEHGSHAMWTVMGKTCAWDSEVLLAPSLIDSAGCSTAALDMDTQHRSVALRMLRNGALAFVGNRRRGAAQQELFHTEFLNAVLTGQSLGEANRAALNRVLVAMLDGDGVDPHMLRYQLHAATAFGDPAVRFDLVPSEWQGLARIELQNLRATVLAPETWYRSEYAPLAEWGCPVQKLYTWRALGIGIDSTWFGPRKRNADRAVFTAEVRTKRRIDKVEAIGNPEGTLGFDGRFFVDEHDDGTRSIYWRVRLVDFDMEAGEIVAQRSRAEYRLRPR
jgi:hypothetical protein